MISEDGSIKTANIAVAPALTLYRKKLKTVALISLIVSAVGLVMYIVGSCFETENGEAPRWLDIFLVFSVPFTLGLIGYITIVRLGKREAAEERTAELIFYADCFFYNSKTAIQSSDTVEKIAYPDATLKRENEKYGYIYVFSRGIFAAFSKEGLSAAELNAIRKCFRHSPDGETCELKNYKKNEENKNN